MFFFSMLILDASKTVDTPKLFPRCTKCVFYLWPTAHSLLLFHPLYLNPVFWFRFFEKLFGHFTVLSFCYANDFYTTVASEAQGVISYSLLIYTLFRLSHIDTHFKMHRKIPHIFSYFDIWFERSSRKLIQFKQRSFIYIFDAEIYLYGTLYIRKIFDYKANAHTHNINSFFEDSKRDIM